LICINKVDASWYDSFVQDIQDSEIQHRWDTWVAKYIKPYLRDNDTVVYTCLIEPSAKVLNVSALESWREFKMKNNVKDVNCVKEWVESIRNQILVVN